MNGEWSPNAAELPSLVAAELGRTAIDQGRGETFEGVVHLRTNSITYASRSANLLVGAPGNIWGPRRHRHTLEPGVASDRVE